MSVLTDADRKKSWFVTGGAGFIGSHAVDLLVSAGARVTVYDNLSLATDEHIAAHVAAGRITFHKRDLRDLDALVWAMEGHDVVWHLGANTAIPLGFFEHRIDLENSVVGTFNVLEAMARTHVKDLLFASTGAVYGEAIRETFVENAGPLFPLSLYGAGKIASEAFVAAYASLFGLRAWMFRFGNVLGGRCNHGVLVDFIAKLKKDPKRLEILGTGHGEKNYFLVEDCISGMLFVYHRLADGPFPVLINLGNESRTTVMSIARIVIEELGLSDVEHSFTGTPVGWPGDQPVVLLDTAKLRALGWRARCTSDEAVRVATRRLLGTSAFALSVETL
jgi:UDP-glucose 4-epimerase